MIIGVGKNHQPYIDLDPFIPINELKAMDLNICRGIALSGTITGSYGRRLLDPTSEDLFYAIERIKSDKTHTDYIQGFTVEQLMKYVKLINPTKSFADVIFLREPITTGTNNSGIDISENNQNTENIQYFPFLMSFINQLPFKEIGRVIIFLAGENDRGEVHTDAWSSNHEFIWLSPRLNKRFFVYDLDLNKKIYITSCSAYFNDDDFHGYDPVDSSTFSIRIDGQFTDDFKEKIDLL